MGTTTSHDVRRRTLAWVLCAGMLFGFAWAGFGCMPQASANPRPVTAQETERLARTRLTNSEAGVVAIAVQFPKDVGGSHWTGHVDWSVPIVNARMTAPDSDDRLIQAVPGVVATRPADATDAPAPRDGWATRSSGTTTAPGEFAADIVASAVLSLASAEETNTKRLRNQVTWLDDGIIDGVAVNAFRAPLLLGGNNTADGSGASAEAVFWVDDDSRLRRVQFSPGSTELATVDFLLEDDTTTAIVPAGVLGGAPVTPRDFTDDEATMLSGMRQRNTGGAQIDIELPTGDGELTQATGFVDWSVPAAYVVVNAPGEDNDGLRYAGATGVARRLGEAADGPPLPIPVDGWSGTGWTAGATNGNLDAIDLLLYRIVAMTTSVADNPAAIKESGSWLRADTIDGVDASVVELQLPGDADAEPGTAPFRYWVGDGRLKRIEMRVSSLGLGFAALTPADTPSIWGPYEVTSLLV